MHYCVCSVGSVIERRSGFIQVLYSKFPIIRKYYLLAATDIRVWTLDVNAEKLCQLRGVEVSISRQFFASCISFSSNNFFAC